MTTITGPSSAVQPLTSESGKVWFSVTELSSHPTCGVPHCEVKPSGRLYDFGRRMRAVSALHHETDCLSLLARENDPRTTTAEQIFEATAKSLYRLEREVLRVRPRTHADAATLFALICSFADAMANCKPTAEDTELLNNALWSVAPFLARGAGVRADDVGWGEPRLWPDEIAFDRASQVA